AAPPAPADRATVLREAADQIAGIDFHPNARARSLDIAAGLAHRLRALADEAAAGVQPPTEGETDDVRARFEALAAEWEKRGEYGDASLLWGARAIRATLAADAAAGVQPPTEGEARPDDIQVWPLTRVLTEVRCGSQDWTWDEEWADLDQRHAETGYLDSLEQQIRANGITMPVLIGSDGRLWDGHHRLRIAVRLGIAYVPVEITPPAVAPAPEVARG
ncbi:ParB N-terminal domain-containing protein, partial [Streptomyces cyaneofuscatus]|uniref:ParB N-terminal domain-containing protein n=1 Tax=Streptomyces cyaneofuscatus TaxID=66883 RepID=UPI0033BA3A33